MTYKGIDLTWIITGLITVVGSLLSWASIKISGAVTSEKNAQAALIRVGALVTALLGRAWEALSPQVQAVIADGKVTAEERAALEAAVKNVVYSFVDEKELSELAKALGLPLPGLIAKIASMVLDQFTKAHDPNIGDVSSKAFPVFTDNG